MMKLSSSRRGARTATTFSLALLIGAAGAIACGNSDDDANGGTTPVTTGSGSCTPPADECSLLTTDEAATALDVSTTMSTAGTMGPGDTSINEPASGTCSWAGGGTDDAVDEMVVAYICGDQSAVQTAEVDEMKEQVGAGTAVTVSGVGSSAIWETSSSDTLPDDGGVITGGILTAVTGDGYIILTIVGSGTPADLQARATVAAGLVVSRL